MSDKTKSVTGIGFVSDKKMLADLLRSNCQKIPPKILVKQHLDD